MPLQGGRRMQTRRPRRLLNAAVAVLALAALTACGNPPPDPGATRTDAQSKELRDRILETQGRT